MQVVVYKDKGQRVSRGAETGVVGRMANPGRYVVTISTAMQYPSD
jgi:hypothetical protein